MNGEYVRADRWSEALALTAIPPHCEGTLKVTYKTYKDFRSQYFEANFQGIQTLCDDIWYHAGDNSTDYNWLVLGGFFLMFEITGTQNASPLQLCMAQLKFSCCRIGISFLK